MSLDLQFDRCGILLAGGMGTRLYPLTSVISKHLLPIHNKPMIYYSLSTLMLAGIRDILIIGTSRDINHYELMFDNGSRLGLRLSYAVQDHPRGISDAFLIGQEFISDRPICLALGDNMFYGAGFGDLVRKIGNSHDGASIFAVKVGDPSRFGVLNVSDEGYVVSVDEKPTSPQSDLAIPGFYFFDRKVSYLAKQLTPSRRGELEVTDLLNAYCAVNELSYQVLPRGISWFDMGTPDSLLEASNFVYSLEKRHNIVISCLEELAFRNGWIGETELYDFISGSPTSSYTNYIRSLLSNG